METITLNQATKQILQRYKELPKNMQTQLYDFSFFLYQKHQKSNKISELATDYDTFEQWNEALDKIGKYHSNEFLQEEGMTVKEYRKMIWDMEQSGEGINLVEFKNEMKTWIKEL